MGRKLMRFGLCALFASCGAWLFCYGVGLLQVSNDPMPAFSSWAWSVPIANFFARLAPTVSIGWWVGASVNAIRAQVPVHVAGALLYFAAATALLIGRDKDRKFVALASWISAMSLAFRIGEFLIHGELSPYLLLDLLLLLGYIYLGFRADAGSFTPFTQQTSARRLKLRAAITQTDSLASEQIDSNSSRNEPRLSLKFILGIRCAPVGSSTLRLHQFPGISVPITEFNPGHWRRY